MKYIKSSTGQNIIKDSDINLSESFNNQKLSDVLVDYRNELNSLKSNVKWLAKYGGVGGSGSGGSNMQNVKLKYKVDVIYKNLNGDETIKENITSGSTCEDLLAQPGYITFRITLVKCMPNTSYRVAIIRGDKTDDFVLNSSDIHITRQISCDNNQDFIIRVWSIPDDLSEVKIPIYTKFNDVLLNFVYDGANIGDGGLIYEETKNSTTLIGTIINYLPNKFNAEFTLLLVNGNSVSFTPQRVDDYTIQFQMNASDVVNLFGIYELILNYVYNGVPDLVKQVCIYKDENPFIYCFGKTNTVYSQDQTAPAVSNFSYETVYFTIYPKQGDSSTTIYSDVLCTISYEGLTNKFSTKSNYASYTEYSVSFLNIFSDEDFKTSDFKKITITFTILGINYVYYLFVKKIDDVEYIFKYKYTQGGLNIEELFYNAIHACTAIPGSEAEITTFPTTTGTTIRILEETTHIIKKLANNTSLTLDVKYIYGTAGVVENVFTHGYITNYKKQSGGDIPDMLLSFGLKYLELNTDLPIVSIRIDNSNSITLYSNKIKYNDQEYTRWCIPNDGQYHLVQLYYKPCYTITGQNYINNFPTDNAAFIFCIDGIFETSPIILNSKLGFLERTSSVTYHPGNWEFNLLGIASFNAKPSPNEWKDKTYNDLVVKYILDFDPIIPANYYLAYYQYTNNTPLPQVLDKSIYQLLYSNDSNNSYGINYYKKCNKFIPVDIKTISSLSSLPVYVISPTSDVKEPNINQFLYNTYAGKYGEGALPVPVLCQFKKAEVRDGLLSLHEMVSDSKYAFLIQYLGSSTLKFGAKNFEISAVPYSEVGEEPKNIVWTPDENVFLPESSFVLKADIVDSSHSNNVVVGKFINEYMSEFSFSDGNNDKIKTCLEGFPILLFMEDVTTDGVSNMVFLGIYSFNLGRNSVFNLGYKKIDLERCLDISNSNNINARAYLVENDTITYPYNYRVAEVLGNSHLLYDYSLYDTFVLKDMLGDFYNYDGSSENNSYSDSFGKPFLGLCKLIWQVFIGNLNNFDTFAFSNNELVGYYRPKTNDGLFNVLLLNFNCTDTNYVTQVLDSYYYAESADNYKKVPLQSLVLTLQAIEYIMPYCIETDNNLTVINNPLYRFHRICSNVGIALDQKLYYVEKLENLPTFDMQIDDCFDYNNILKYYMVCMIFAMVDSVLKNLTMRCKNYTNGNPNTWLAGFYDMDTSFGLNNSGGISDFKAFSDFITDNGNIISDFFQMNSNNTEGSGFDSPSSFLFLVAKYLNILTPDMDQLNVPILNRIFRNNESTDVLRTPYNYWYELRQKQLTSVDHFFSTYVDGHFQNVHPLIWNLNYLYKYFSASGVTNGDTETEQSKFHGTRRFSRKQWFELRLGILDVLFGIRNNHTVGNSLANYICKLTANQTAQLQQEYKFNILGIPISQSMFPLFSKGVEGITINADVTIYPKAPIVLLTSVSDYKLYIADNAGKINNIRGNIGTNVDVGFYGTLPIRELSEFGQFLTASSAGGSNKLNTIENLFITSINIDYGLENASLYIKLSLDKTKSVKTIFVNNSGSKNKIYKCNTINIDSNSEFVLENLTIKYSKLTDLILGNDDPLNTIRIKKLILEENNIQNLIVKNVIVEELIISNCSIISYNLNGDFPNLNINDSVTTKFKLDCSSSNGIEVTLNTQSLLELDLQGHIKRFTNATTASSCRYININNLISNSVTLKLDNFINYQGKINICFADGTLCDDIYISGQNNHKCTEYHIKGNINNEGIHLLPYAFSKNKNLLALLLNNLRIIANKSFVIHGDGIFEYCDNLPIDLIIKGSNSEKLQIDDKVTSCKYLFRKCPKLTIEDAINIITNLTGGPNRLNLSGMFIGCSNIKLELELVSGKYRINNIYKTLLALLENADITNGKGDLVTICDNFFTGTGVKLIEENLVHFFTYKDEGKYILPNIISGTTEMYMTSDALSPWNNSKGEPVKITNISIGKYIWNDNTGYATTPIKILEKLLGLDDLYEVMTNVNLYNLLGGTDSKIETIDGLHLYTDENICIDCTDGLPASVKSLKYFCCKVDDFNFNNLLNLFNNVGDDCLVFMDTFFGLLTLKNSKLLSVDLYLLLFNGDNPKVTMKLHSKFVPNSSSVNRHHDDGRSCMNFPKICTQNEFKIIMNYLMEQQNYYLTNGTAPQCDLYNQIPGLFLNCLITNVESFDKLISIEDDNNNTYFDSKTNGARTVSFIDLDMTFKNCILLNGNITVYFKPHDMWKVSTLVFILRETFMNTDQEMLLGPYVINSVIDMLNCFYNCKYNITYPKLELLYVPTSKTFEVNWYWYDNFPIIPSKFFDICSNSANINNCFSASEIRSTNLLGQLPQNLNLMWWTNLSTTSADICTNALIHPMWKGGNFYIYPKYYTDVFKLLQNAYKHVILPLETNEEKCLYIFETTDGVLLKPKLPKLPNDSNHAANYTSFLRKDDSTYKVRLNSNDLLVGLNMFSTDYQKLLDRSLFSVLNGLELPESVSSILKPLIDNGIYNYTDTIGDDGNGVTPGGIVVSDLNPIILNAL